MNAQAPLSMLDGAKPLANPLATRTIRRMRDELCQWDVEVLREDSGVRREVAASAQAIFDDVSAYLA